MPKNQRDDGPGPVDEAILRLLAQDARMPNSAIAAAVGVAPSTCLARIRSLRERGVIRGFRAELDPAALGLGIQAMISVRLHSHSRGQVDSFVREIPRLPGVVDLFHVSGADDYLLRVAVRDSDALRDFVLDHLTTHPAVRHTETSLIFGHVRGRLLPPARSGPEALPRSARGPASRAFADGH
ncbi:MULTISPECIES: Lrp/AsnC family transcriptional regulator [Streptomycetaceae]|nr:MULTISPECIES: Lrp/AsnC family transcriptional regulator [Streptomycetaceae]